MIKKLFSVQSQSITGAAVILGVASFLSRVSGVVRDRIFTHTFGAGDTLDAYYAAFRAPDLIYNLLIIGALSASFIPTFTKLYHQNKNAAWRITSTIINLLAISLFILCTILFIFTPFVTKIITPGFSDEKLHNTIMLTRIMLLSPIILGLSSIASGILQSLKSFFIYAATPILYNIGIIIGAIVFMPHFGIIGLGYGVVLGALLHLSLQIPAIVHFGFRYYPVILINRPVQKMISLMVPRTIGLAANQLTLLFITMIASTIGTGAITVFNLANNLQYFAVGIIGVSFAIAAFPTLAEFSAKNKQAEFIDHLASTIRQVIFFIIPIMVVFLLLRAQIVRILLGSGAFNWPATIATSNALAFFSFSLFSQCLTPLLARACYALEDTWSPLWTGLAGAGVTILGGYITKDAYGLMGLVAAFSIGSIIQLILLWLLLRKKIGTLQELKLLHLLYKISIGAIGMGITVQFLKNKLSPLVNMDTFFGILFQGSIAGICGIAVYGLIAYILRVDEIQEFTKSITKKLFKQKNIPTEIIEK